MIDRPYISEPVGRDNNAWYKRQRDPFWILLQRIYPLPTFGHDHDDQQTRKRPNNTMPDDFCRIIGSQLFKIERESAPNTESDKRGDDTTSRRFDGNDGFFDDILGGHNTIQRVRAKRDLTCFYKQ